MRKILKVLPSQHSDCFYQSQQKGQQKGQYSSPQTQLEYPATWSKGRHKKNGKCLLGPVVQTQRTKQKQEIIFLYTYLIQCQDSNSSDFHPPSDR